MLDLVVAIAAMQQDVLRVGQTPSDGLMILSLPAACQTPSSGKGCLFVA